MTTEPIKKIHEGTDADAAYVLRRIALIDECEKDITTRREQRDAAVKESGLRLIEVHAKRSQKNVTDIAASDTLLGTWDAWLNDNGINKMTAWRHMQIAGHTEEERTEKKQKDAKRKKDARAGQFRVGWVELLVERLGGTNHQYKSDKTKIEKAIGRTVPKYFTDKAQGEAFVLDFVKVFPNKIEKKPDLSESQKQKVDRAIAIEKAMLEANRLKDLYALFNEKLPELKAERDQLMEECREETARYRLLNMNTRKFITAAEYRKLIWALHPDRAPEDRKEEFNTATIIVMKLKAYAEA